MSPPLYNALAAKTALANKPLPATVAPAPKPVQPSATPTRFNARPNKDANAGQSPAMVGDKQRIARPPAVALPSTAQPRLTEQRSGMETAMGAAADSLHPVKRR